MAIEPWHAQDFTSNIMTWDNRESRLHSIRRRPCRLLAPRQRGATRATRTADTAHTRARRSASSRGCCMLNLLYGGTQHLKLPLPWSCRSRDRFRTISIVPMCRIAMKSNSFANKSYQRHNKTAVPWKGCIKRICPAHPKQFLSAQTTASLTLHPSTPTLP